VCCTAVCYSVLQCVVVCGSVLQCVSVCCSVLQCVAVWSSMLQCIEVCCSVLQCVHVQGASVIARGSALCLNRRFNFVECCVFFNPHILQRTTQACVYFFQSIQTHQTATDCNRLQHTATRCNILQHTATHYITLQHTPAL